MIAATLIPINTQYIKIVSMICVINISPLAEAVRFELTDLLQSLVFKTSALNHSATLPKTGATGQIRTDGFRDLQSLALDHSATVALLVHRDGFEPPTTCL